MTQHLYQGDARQLDMIPDGSIDLVVTSPPYLKQRRYGWSDDEVGRSQTLAEYVDEMVTVFAELRRTMRPGTSSAFLNIGDKANNSGGAGGDWMKRQHRPDGGKGNAARAAADGGPGKFEDPACPENSFLDVPGAVVAALMRDGWRLRLPIVWDKGRETPEALSYVRRPRWSHEMIYLLTPWRRARRRGEPRPNFYPSGLIETGSVWHFPPRNVRPPGVPKPDPHLAPFPDELARRCILACTLPGHTVLDPFMGSGTVPRVAEQMGRIGYGVDLYHGRPEMLTTHERPT